MLVIGSMDNQFLKYIGKDVYLCDDGQFWDKKYSHDSRYGDNEYKLYALDASKKV